MGAATSTTQRTRQEAINEFYQRSSASCLANTENILENVTVYIGPGASVGNINFTQKATTTGSCLLNTNMSAVTNSKFQSIQEQKIKNGLVLPISFVYTTTTNINTQMVRNLMSQVISSQCQFNSRDIQRNILVYIAERARAGDVNFTQTSTSNVECSIYNTAMIEANMDASSTQKTSVSNGIDIAGILIAVAIIAGIVFLLFILIKTIGRPKPAPGPTIIVGDQVAPVPPAVSTVPVAPVVPVPPAVSTVPVAPVVAPVVAQEVPAVSTVPVALEEVKSSG